MDDTMSPFGYHPQSIIHHQDSGLIPFPELQYFEKPRFPVVMRTQNSGSKLVVPFKSRFCLLYQKGRCYYGEQCHFVHDINEIRNPSSSGLDTARNGCHSDNRNGDVGKIAKCRWFSNGKFCPYGDKCQFLHKCDRVECESLNTDEDYERGIFQKMKLCNRWEKFGNCPYGVKCIFAHGNAELKKMSSHAVPGCGYTNSKLKLQTSQSKAAAATSKITFETAHKVQPEGKRNFMKWNIDRMSRVYADWIDSTNCLPVL